MSAAPSVAAIVTVTNPASSGYWVYLACIASLCRVMDEVVVIDGGSDDGSLERLRDWLGADAARMRVIADEAVYWGRGDAFHLHQINVSYDHVLRGLEHDWVFAMPADQVAWGWDPAALRRTLREHDGAAYASFHRSKVLNGTPSRRVDQRGIAVNLARCRARGIHLCWGDAGGRAGDFPLRGERKSTYLDPANGSRRTIYAGTELPPEALLELECGTYGHFFLTPEQAMEKSRRWDRVAARYYGYPPAGDREIRLRQRIPSCARWLPRATVGAWEFPPEMERVVREHYHEGMLGGAVDESRGRPRAATRALLAAGRRVGAGLLRLRGFPVLRDLHAWADLDGPDPEPVDVAAAYERQDEVLGLRPARGRARAAASAGAGRP